MPEKKPAYNDSLNLPYSLEAEQSVLGSVLIDASCMDLVADMIPNEEYFYLPEHQAAYRVMLQKMMANRTIDFVTVLEDLKSEGFYSGEEGKAYLYKLTQIVPSIGNVSRYAEIVRSKFDIRRLINATREILDECMDGTADPAMLIDSAEQKIYDIRRERIRGGLTPISQTIVANYEILDNMQDPVKRQRYIGIPTGIRDLDTVISGLNRSGLIIDSVTARLCSFPNVVMTSHQAFFTQEALAEIAHVNLKNATAYANGAPDDDYVFRSIVC